MKSTVAVLACLAALATPAAAEEGVTPLRAKVRAWERTVLAHALGSRAQADAAIKPKIVGGAKAPKGKWPFQVGLLDASIKKNFNAQFCGGTLVAPLFVITAAHCVVGESPTTIQVLTGTQSLTGDGVRRQVAKIIKHPNYNNKTSDYDIAVIKLKTPANGLKYATLLSKAEESGRADAGTQAFVTGWGDQGDYPTDLREVKVPIVSRRDCNDGNSYQGEITARMICAGFTTGGEDSCQGDSGGPLVVKDVDGKWRLLAGIVSWGDGCAEPNLFGVYSRVAVLSNWANKVIAAQGGDAAVADEPDISCEGLHGGALAACLDRSSLAPQ
jgi:secreted trypsin-like serine protease